MPPSVASLGGRRVASLSGSPSVADPSLEDKLTIVELLSELGVASADVGLPGAGRRAAEDACAVIQHIVDNYMCTQKAVRSRRTPRSR